MYLLNGITEAHDVDLHVSRTPQAGSHDQVTLRQVYTIALPLEAS